MSPLPQCFFQPDFIFLYFHGAPSQLFCANFRKGLLNLFVDFICMVGPFGRVFPIQLDCVSSKSTGRVVSHLLVELLQRFIDFLFLLENSLPLVEALIGVYLNQGKFRPKVAQQATFGSTVWCSVYVWLQSPYRHFNLCSLLSMPLLRGLEID